ncbi:MAG: hypothetical protein JXA49_06565, partial [Actinobacteria bacterium]|nr:hypothetical protein [Actinomycetota bacterium]
LSIDPHDMGKDAYEVVIQTTIRGCFIFKAAFMPTGSWGCFTPMTYETIDNIWKINQPVNEQIKKDLIARGDIEDDGIDNTYASLDEHGHFGHCESPFHVEFWEPKEQCISGMIDGVIQGVKHHIPILYSPMATDPADLLAYAKYLGKIQKMIDPSGVMDSMMGGMMGMMRDLDDIEELEAIGEGQPEVVA